MDIAEILTPIGMLYYRFDSTETDQVSEVQDAIGELSDRGMVLALEFHKEQ